MGAHLRGPANSRRLSFVARVRSVSRWFESIPAAKPTKAEKNGHASNGASHHIPAAGKSGGSGAMLNGVASAVIQ